MKTFGNIFAHFAGSIILTFFIYLVFCFLFWDFWPDDKFEKELVSKMLRLIWIIVFVCITPTVWKDKK